jgi:3-phenylpropionate/trans-cinnamate dioxygenase ferredoxin component
MLYGETDLDPYNFYPVANLDEIAPGERLYFDIGDQPIVMINLSGKLFAVGDVCSHDNGPLGDGEVDECEIICPRHGARFDLRTGKATRLPAVKAIPSYPVRIDGNTIQVGLLKK